jgi:hypothetical protein
LPQEKLSSTLRLGQAAKKEGNMTIEIHRPELEALINERLKSGTFGSIEDFLMQALQNSPIPENKGKGTGADLVAAMQSSPYKEIEIEEMRVRPPVRDVKF